MSSWAPSLIQRRTSATSAADSGFPCFGISATPSGPAVITSRSRLSSGLEGTIPAIPESPGANIRATSVMTKAPLALAGW